MVAAALRSPGVGRKKKIGPSKQVNFRMDLDMADRIDAIAEMLRSDASHVIRLILLAGIDDVEERAKIFSDEQSRS